MCSCCMLIGHVWHQRHRQNKDLRQGRRLATQDQSNTKGEIRIRKHDLSEYVVHLSLSVYMSRVRYPNNGYSRHMIGRKECWTNHIESSLGSVAFGDSVNSKVVGFGIVNVKRMSQLTNVHYVEGMKANLTSMSQMCDDDLHVHFDKQWYYVLKKCEECVITGTRTSENCYQINETIDSIHKESLKALMLSIMIVHRTHNYNIMLNLTL